MTDHLPVMKTHQVRPYSAYCHLNRKVKKKRLRIVTSPNGKYDYIPTQEDVRKFDHIVLTDSQISVCRLLDCFAPTPQTLIDMSDQLIETHQWADDSDGISFMK